MIFQPIPAHEQKITSWPLQAGADLDPLKPGEAAIRGRAWAIAASKAALWPGRMLNKADSRIMMKMSKLVPTYKSKILA